MPVLMHRPPKAIEGISPYDSSIFLGGPIVGAPDWQLEATSILGRQKCAARSGTNLHITNPRLNFIGREFDWDKQARWKKVFLSRASKNGAIIFWFAAQDLSQPYPEGRPYAQSSCIEFGRVIGWHDDNPDMNVAIGIEDGYVGREREIRSYAEEKDLLVHRSLDAVCLQALMAVTKEREHGEF